MKIFPFKYEKKMKEKFILDRLLKMTNKLM